MALKTPLTAEEKDAKVNLIRSLTLTKSLAKNTQDEFNMVAQQYVVGVYVAIYRNGSIFQQAIVAARSKANSSAKSWAKKLVNEGFEQTHIQYDNIVVAE